MKIYKLEITSSPLRIMISRSDLCLSYHKNTENIGIAELQVIPNVCSEHSERKIQAIGWSH